VQNTSGFPRFTIRNNIKTTKIAFFSILYENIRLFAYILVDYYVFVKIPAFLRLGRRKISRHA